MTSEDSMKLAASYLSGDASPEERKIFESWLTESLQNEELFKDFQKIWESSTIRLEMPEGETATEWQALVERIRREESSGPFRFTLNFALKIAASLIVIVAAYWILRPNNEQTINYSQAEIVVESAEEETTFYLPDSSKVWLQANSTLTYKETFGKEIREVQLRGEGNFVVKPDTLRPFFVISEYAVVQVVGTSFNVKEDSVVTVSVSEGIVKLYAREAPEDAVLVKRGEKAFVKRHKRAKPVKLKREAPTPSPARSGSNTVYDREVKNPLSYLSTKFTWKKNQFNQSVVDGTILNAASLASYKNIVLKIMYTKPNGKKVTTFITVYESIGPGERIDFHKNLVDIFSNTKTLNVIIDSAEVDAPSN